MADEDIELVEAEIVVDYEPKHSTPLIPMVSAESLPKDAVPAPPPEQLLGGRNGYFVKGGRPGPGRPRIIKSPQQMQEAIDKYFSELLVSIQDPDSGQISYAWSRPPTIPGLARALGMHADTLRDYRHTEEYGDIVTEAVDVIKEYLETGVCQAGNQSGRIFLMKNLGYSDTKTYTFTPPSRLEAAKSPDEIAQLVSEDIVD